MGFNNTGNVCVWPSEELLTHLVLTRPSEWYDDKVVLELGTPPSCF
jgi:calmodulin-lysine N-methyltransferase